jgi:hypothetical protein
LPDKQSGIFFARGLDHPNQPDLPDEISFCAHAISSQRVRAKAVQPQIAA